MSESLSVSDANLVLTLEELGTLAAEAGKPAETLMNVVALIADRFKVMYVRHICWSLIAPIWCWPLRWDCARMRRDAAHGFA
jgi:hypothetical protein